MQITIDLDLQKLIADAVNTERLQPLIDKAIVSAISSAIDDATGYRSQFREELKKQLSDSMPHGLSIDDCAKFQQMANAAVTEVVHGANAETIQTALRESFKAMVPDVPTVIKLSELMKKARGGFHKEQHEAFYAHLETSQYGGARLYLDSNEDCREKYRADICIAFNKEGEVYSLKLDGIDITPKSAPDAIGRFDGLLLSLYVGRTKLEIDMDEGDVEGAASEQYD